MGDDCARRHASTPLQIEDSAWIHALLALLASLFGFAASYVYLERSHTTSDPWAFKMAFHMAAWHLLLVLTLFPTSLLGRRTGVRVVRSVSTAFFAIHLGFAIANSDSASLLGVGAWIALLNGVSGLFFLSAAAYGSRVVPT